MRPIWKGVISFGLVSIPVKVFPATEEKSLRFNQLHVHDGETPGRLRYKRVCQKCGQEVEFEDISKGYEYSKDQYVVLDDEDLEAVPVESSRAIDIAQFVDLDEIDPVQYQKSYYLSPEETGVKAYRLLADALADDGKAGIAKVAMRGKEHLAALRLRDGVLVMETMYWPDEIRQPAFDELDQEVKTSDQEVQMAQTLIEQLTASWDPTKFKDEYREALLEIVEKKVAGEEVEVVEAEEAPKVVDLMDALKQSVEETKRRAKKRPAKKAAGKKQAKAS